MANLTVRPCLDTPPLLGPAAAGPFVADGEVRRKLNGAKNRRTLIREARVRSAEAATQLRPGADDSLSIMEEAMRSFYKLAKEAKEQAEKASHLIIAASIAEKVAPYRFPRLSTVKVGGDKSNPLLVREGITAQQVRDELLADMAATGLIPTPIAGLLEDLGGVAPNGRRRKPS